MNEKNFLNDLINITKNKFAQFGLNKEPIWGQIIIIIYLDPKMALNISRGS